jgi:hypothetical protein
MSPDEIRQQIKDAMEAARKFTAEQNVPDSLKLAVETTGEAFLNTYEFSHEWVTEGLGARTQ